MSKGLNWVEEVELSDGLVLSEVGLDYEKMSEVLGEEIAEKLLDFEDAVSLIVSNIVISGTRSLLYLGNKTQTHRVRFIDNMRINGWVAPFIVGVVKVEKSGLQFHAADLLAFLYGVEESKRASPSGYDLVLDF